MKSSLNLPVRVSSNFVCISSKGTVFTAFSFSGICFCPTHGEVGKSAAFVYLAMCILVGMRVKSEYIE